MNNLENIFVGYSTFTLIILIMYTILPFIIIFAYSIICKRLKKMEKSINEKLEEEQKILKMIDVRIEDIRLKK